MEALNRTSGSARSYHQKLDDSEARCNQVHQENSVLPVAEKRPQVLQETISHISTIKV